MRWTSIGGIILAAVLLAGVGDALSHQAGTAAAFNGVNGLLSSTYTAAAGGA